MCFTALLLKGPINSITTHHFHIYNARKKNSLTYAVTKNVVELNLEISYISCVGPTVLVSCGLFNSVLRCYVV